MNQAADRSQTVLRDWQAGDAVWLAGWHMQTGEPLQLAGAESEWLILAEPGSGAPLACLRLVKHLGMALPRFSYHVGRVVHAAAELGLRRAQTTLLLGNDHSGESELADLACAADLPAEAQATCLQRLIEAALQRIQAQPAEYGERLVVELAGPRDGAGRAPFWQGLGAHFYAGDPATAQARLGEGWRSHLAALLPRQTLYVSFLSEAAQAALGQVGTSGEAAAQALRATGFAYSQHVRIDDGGPVWERRLRPS